MELTIKINNQSKQAKLLYEYLKTLPFVKIERKKKSPYNPEFVEMVKKSVASKKRYEVKNVDELWENI